MKKYNIPYVKDRQDFKRKVSLTEKIQINEFPWNAQYKPETWAAVAYSDSAIYVHMETKERYIRAVHTAVNGAIYTDSCMEFYVRPCLENNNYFNIEINPIGTVYLSVGANRGERLLIDEIGAEALQIETNIKHFSKNNIVWSVEYKIPYRFIKEYIPEFSIGQQLLMEGNFYKCGNELPEVHWGCWNYVNSLKPDFHRPECFGRIIGI